MKRYADTTGTSGIDSYEYGEGFIIIGFKKGEYTVYTYTNVTAGAQHVENMQSLADNGHGLNAYIKRHEPKYATREKG